MEGWLIMVNKISYPKNRRHIAGGGGGLFDRRLSREGVTVFCLLQLVLY